MMTTDHWMRPVTGSALVCGQRETVQLLLHYDPANPQLLELVTGYDATGRRTSWKLERTALSAALTEQRLVYTRGVVAWPIEDHRVAGGVLALERYRAWGSGPGVPARRPRRRHPGQQLPAGPAGGRGRLVGRRSRSAAHPRR